MSIFTDIENFITTKVWPFLRNIGKSVVQAEINQFEPEATAVVAEMADAVTSAKSTPDLGQALASIIIKATANAGERAIAAGASAILASVGTALATNTTTATSLAPAKPAS